VTDQIDFAEHGRLLGLRSLCGNLEDDSVLSDSVNIMSVRVRLEGAMEDLERVTDAYRAVVLAAKALRSRMSLANEGDSMVVSSDVVDTLDAALARFCNVGEAQP
jgi:hypothetical protein